MTGMMTAAQLSNTPQLYEICNTQDQGIKDFLRTTEEAGGGDKNHKQGLARE